MTNQPHSSSGTGETARQEAAHVTGYARDSASDVAGTAKERAGEVAGTAKDRAQDVAGAAVEKGKETAEEARLQAREMFDQTRQELTTQAEQQQRRLAGTMQSLSGELRSMASTSQEQGMATDLARQASDYLGRAGRWLEAREPGDVLDEVKRFARNRPAAFLAVSAGLGLLAGRVARGLKDAGEQQSRTGSGTTARSGTYGTDRGPVDGVAGYRTATGYGTSTGTTGTAGYRTGSPVSGMSATSTDEPSMPPTIPPAGRAGSAGDREDVPHVTPAREHEHRGEQP